MKRLVSILVSVSLLLLSPIYSYAAEDNSTDEHIHAKAVVLMDTDSKEVLYKMNENEELSPASVTKIMSLLIILEALDSEKITLLDEVTASNDAVAMGGSQIWLEVGEKMTVDELLRAVIIASANDACTALGEYVAGSSVAFVKMMNDKAKELGLEHTNFENCTGLDDTVKAHYSSAYDLAVIASEVMKYDIVKKYSTVWLDSLRDGKTELNNTNKLVNTYDGITGLKTGTTSNAGFCVAATASRDNLNLVAVVLGSDTSDHRFDTAAYLLDIGFANYKSFTPEIDETQLTPVKVNNGIQKYVTPIYPDMTKITLPKGDNNVEYKYNISKSTAAPVHYGDKLGTVEVLCDGESVASVALTAGENIDKITFFDVLWNMVRNI